MVLQVVSGEDTQVAGCSVRTRLVYLCSAKFYSVSGQPDVLMEDNHLLVVNKPAGWLVQGDSTGDRTLADWCKDYIGRKYNKPGAVFLGVVHRIDRPVSGVVVFARTSKALARMNEIFRQRSLKKIYVALVEGQAPAQKQLIHWLKKNESANRANIFREETEGASRCELSFRKITSASGLSLLEVMPVTGRPHQIRAQLSAIGLPIVGDLKYGASSPNSDRSICLHAHRLEFVHPVSRQLVVLSAPLPRLDIWQPFRADVT